MQALRDSAQSYHVVLHASGGDGIVYQEPSQEAGRTDGSPLKK